MLEWAARTEAELEATKAHNLVIDLADVKNIDDLRDEVNVAYARHAIAGWVQEAYKDYKVMGDKIVKKNVSKPSRGSIRRSEHMPEPFPPNFNHKTA